MELLFRALEQGAWVAQKCVATPFSPSSNGCRHFWSSSVLIHDPWLPGPWLQACLLVSSIWPALMRLFPGIEGSAIPVQIPCGWMCLWQAPYFALWIVYYVLIIKAFLMLHLGGCPLVFFRLSKSPLTLGGQIKSCSGTDLACSSSFGTPDLE